MKQIIINSEELQVRVAVVEDGKLQDFFMERTNKDRIVGSIYKGRIKNLEPSLQAAFVDIGVGKNAFLHYWDMLPASQEMLEDGDEDEDEEHKADFPADDDEEDDGRGSCTDGCGDDVADECADKSAGDEEAPYLPGSALRGRLHRGGGQFESNPSGNGSVTRHLLPLTKEAKGSIIPLCKSASSQDEPSGGAAEADSEDTTQQVSLMPIPIQDNPPPAELQNNGNRNGNGSQGNGNGNRNGNGSGSNRGNGGHHRHHRGHGSGDNRTNENGRKNAAPASQGPAKTGFLRRLWNALFGGSENQQNTGKGRSQVSGRQNSRGQLAPLAPSTNKNGAVSEGKKQLLPLSKDENAVSQQRKAPRPAKPEKKGPTVEDIPNLFHVDQEILVQVTKGPIGTKGARVTTNLSIPGRNLVLLPNCSHVGISRRVEDREERSRLKQMIKTLTLPSNMGLICRTVGAGLKREHFQRDLDILLDAWHHGEELAANRKAPVCIYQEPALEERVLRDCMTQDVDEIIVDTQEAYNRATQMISRFDKESTVKVKLYTNPTPVFIKYGVSQQIENICNRKVMLPSGGYLCIDETEALIAIDVNTGKNRSGKDQPETILETNMEAVKEIARQLRLRNIGGLVVLDLIDMRSRKDQMAVYRAFKQYVSEDHARIKVYPISNLGLLEMSRQRESESWQSTIFEDCPYCKGRGLIKTATSVSVEIQRRLNELMARRKEIKHFVITVHPTILDRLRTADHKVMDAMAAEHDRQLTFTGNANLHIEEYHITDKESGKAL